MPVYLARQGYRYSPTTIHKYMNAEMKLFSIVRPKKPVCRYAKPHKVFDNMLHPDFTAEKPNQKWCTDFTYLFLKNHEVRYNCTILDLYDRSVIASITDRNITSDLAVRTLKKVLESQPSIKEGVILHSDRGTQYTSKALAILPQLSTQKQLLKMQKMRTSHLTRLYLQLLAPTKATNHLNLM